MMKPGDLLAIAFDKVTVHPEWNDWTPWGGEKVDRGAYVILLKPYDHEGVKYVYVLSSVGPGWVKKTFLLLEPILEA